MRLFSVILLYLICCSNIVAQNSSVNFIIKNLGVNVDGHFNEFTIVADFNNDGDLTAIKGTIKVSSIETGIDSRDEHLLKEDYFHQEKFKEITLQSTSVKKKNSKEYDITANLVIKGKMKEIIFPATIQIQPKKAIISSSFEINRRDFDVGGGSFVMSKTVKIQVTHYQDKQ